MIWKELEVQNFLSYEKFKMQLDNRGLILIEGENLTNSKFKSNGSGKSSLLEAIVYALYNTTSKGIKSDEIINNKAKKNTAVILTGMKGEDEYRIERYRKHTKNKDKVKLFRNNEEITAKSTKDTDTMIEQLVGIDYNTFINSIMFSQGSGAGRFAVATDREKKDILENLINLEVYAVAQDIAKDRIKQKDTEITANKQQQERLGWELEQVDALEAQDKANYENTKNLIIKEDADLVANVNAMTDYVETYFQGTERARGEIEELAAKRDSVNTTDISAFMNAVTEANSKVREYTYEIDKYTEKKAKMVSDYKKLEISTHCPVCGSELDTAHREQEMLSIKAELRTVLIRLKQLKEEQEPLTIKYTEAQAAYTTKKQEVDSISSSYQQIVNEIREKEQHVRNYEQSLKNYKDKTEHIKSTLAKLRNMPQPGPRTEDRKVIKDKVKVLKEAHLALERERQQLEDAVKIYSNSGVKSHVLDLITPFLNERANKYLSSLSGPEMEVIFSTQTRNKAGEVTDKFDLQLINHAGGDGYKSNSEGEKKRADLAIALAIQDLVMSKSESATNFVVYDEVFDALDSVGSENVVTLLRERLNTVNSIFVITHSEHLGSLFEKVITVTKNKDGISTVKEGAEVT